MSKDKRKKIKKHYLNNDSRKIDPNKAYPVGYISITRKGFAFVALQAGQEDVDPELKDIFIPPKYVGNALTGDLVSVRITDRFNSKGPSGEVVKVVERNREAFVGQVIEIDETGRRAIVKPVSSAFPRTLAVIITGSDVENGDWLEFSIKNTKEGDRGFDVKFIRRLDRGNNVSGLLDGLTIEFELPEAYTMEEEEQAAALPALEIERRDLTDLITMTIDPIDAKDYDDALSIVSETEKEVVVAIHIADVAAYVSVGSYFDEKAASRSFTNYLPGRMIPMLPRTLLKERCSLNADELKPAHTLFVTINKNSGEIKDYERFHSWVKVTKRLHYDEVQQFLDAKGLSFHGDEKSMFEYKSSLVYDESFESTWQDWSEEVKGSIVNLFGIYKTLRNRRKALEHYVDVTPKEIRLLCSGNPPEVQGIRHEKSDEAHEIVEEFMLLGNTLVAEEMFHSDTPAIYRTHPSPTPESLENFSRWLKEAMDMKAGSLKNRKAINKLLHQFSPEDPYFDVLMVSFVKAMERAQYESECNPHYGLGKEKYLHFTSPIRRYSDLFVHQQLWEQEKGNKIKSGKQAAAMASYITKTEKRYDEAYWTAMDRLKLHFIADKLASGELLKLEAVIMNFTRSEISIYVPELGMFGAIPFSTLGGGYGLSEDRCILSSRKTDRKFTKGEIFYVKILHVDPRSADLQFGVGDA